MAKVIDPAAAREQMTSTDAAIMNIYVSFTEEAGEGSSDGLISQLSLMLSYSAPVIERFGGKISQVSEEGISAVFAHNCENALKCAVEICANSSVSQGKNSLPGLTVGIHYGTVSMGTIGSGSFSTFIAVSADNSLARRISEIAGSLGAGILVTDSAVRRISEFGSRYSSRRIGIIRSRLGGRDIELYDVFDGDPAETKYKKRRSRIFFEKGIELFLAEKYLQARSYFIELLKYDRVDMVAKEYIFKCDRFIADEHSDKSGKYLATV